MNNLEDMLNQLSNEYQKSILEGLNFNNSKLNNNIEDNEKLIRSLCACFSGIFDILSNDISFASYLSNKNLYLTNLSIRYTSYRLSILNDENIEINNKLMLISVLDLISVYIYINKEIFEEQEEYLDKCINHIKDNIEIYKDYFKENGIFDEESSLGPMSSCGFLQEFLVIGEVVNAIYEKENKQNKQKKM